MFISRASFVKQEKTNKIVFFLICPVAAANFIDYINCTKVLLDIFSNIDQKMLFCKVMADAVT